MNLPWLVAAGQYWIKTLGGLGLNPTAVSLLGKAITRIWPFLGAVFTVRCHPVIERFRMAFQNAEYLLELWKTLAKTALQLGQRLPFNRDRLRFYPQKSIFQHIRDNFRSVGGPPFILLIEDAFKRALETILLPELTRLTNRNLLASEIVGRRNRPPRRPKPGFTVSQRRGPRTRDIIHYRGLVGAGALHTARNIARDHRRSKSLSGGSATGAVASVSIVRGRLAPGKAVSNVAQHVRHLRSGDGATAQIGSVRRSSSDRLFLRTVKRGRSNVSTVGSRQPNTGALSHRWRCTNGRPVNPMFYWPVVFRLFGRHEVPWLTFFVSNDDPAMLHNNYICAYVKRITPAAFARLGTQIVKTAWESISCNLVARILWSKRPGDLALTDVFKPTPRRPN